jgi:uncharacterized membrane protein YdfJ with MMPL/SSD domain
MLAMSAILVLAPPIAISGQGWDLGRLGDRLRSGRPGDVAGAIAVRPWLAWIPALLALAVLGLGAAQAFDAGATRLTAGDLPGVSEPETAVELLAEELGPSTTERLTSGPAQVAADATATFDERLPWLLGALTALGILGAWAAARSPRLAIARGVGAALPAAAACGLLVLAGEGRLPFDLELAGRAPHASALFATLAAVGAVSVSRAVAGDLGSALAGTLVAGAVVGSLALADVSGVAQVGAAIAAGLVIDLLLVRAVLSPALERAIPEGPFVPPRMPRPRLPRARLPRPRLPDRFRR